MGSTAWGAFGVVERSGGASHEKIVELDFESLKKEFIEIKRQNCEGDFEKF